MSHSSDSDETFPPEDPVPIPENLPYDSGAALVEENSYYGAEAPDPGTYDPNAIAYDPNAASADPNAMAYDPGAAHIELPPPAAPPLSYPAPDSFETAAQGGGIYDDAPPPPQVVPNAPRPAKKKKVVHRAPARKPVAGRAAPGGRRPTPQPVVYGGGISLMTVLLSLVALGMFAVVVMVAMPKDLSAVAGYPSSPIATGTPPRNLLAEMQKEMIDRKAELVFTEEEVNRYLGRRLAGEQKGALSSLVTFRGVCIDFSPGKAEVVIEREIFGRGLTLSVDLVANEFRRQVVYKPVAWHIGRISLGSRTVKPVVELFSRLLGSLGDEYQSIQQMGSVRFEADRVVVDARI